MKQKKIQRKCTDDDGSRGAEDDALDTSRECADDSDTEEAGFDVKTPPTIPHIHPQQPINMLQQPQHIIYHRDHPVFLDQHRHGLDQHRHDLQQHRHNLEQHRHDLEQHRHEIGEHKDDVGRIRSRSFSELPESDNEEEINVVDPDHGDDVMDNRAVMS